ncbi:MAG: hypothetical protein KJ064_03740 [Anaerolineae bacterium]|nr:hypothetical protein [Anaerolineae bacterium]
MKRDLFYWLVLCITAGAVSLIYLSANTGNDLLMPLDDAYIHFQYAKQMAKGHPYEYNTGDEPTSGATSFLYSPFLAVGYLVGFKGLALSYWAVGLGAVALLFSAWLIYHMLDTWAAYLMPLLFVLMGAMSWAAFSGMETMLFVFAVLFSLFAYQRQEKVALAGVLVALARPEGAVVAFTLIAASAWEKRRFSRQWVLPMLAVFVQPFVNWLVTGSPSATGNQAKSHLYNVTQPPFSRAAEIVETWLRLWRDLLTGYSRVDGWYIFPALTLLALGMMAVGMRKTWQTRRIHPALLGAVWMFLLSGAVATLDTANWHFKRYQMPIFALIFPLAGWLLAIIDHELSARFRWLSRGVMVLSLVFAVWTTIVFAGYYAANIRVVRTQQIAMAVWVDAKLPPDARIAVHDVGVMRYIGNRYTVDVVGLTTEGNAAAWRQGPGTLYEQLTREKPDYFAIYPDVQGLPFLVQAGVFGEELARFELQLPPHTAAAATGIQVVSRADWSGTAAAETPHQFYSETARLLGVLNVADVTSEDGFGYQWHNTRTPDGFITMVRQLPYFACAAEPCTIIDGGRLITGGEKFTLPSLEPGEQYLVVARVEAASSTTLKIGCTAVEEVAVVPALPGQWFEVPILFETQDESFCVETSGDYFSYRYWIYAVPASDYEPQKEILAEFTDPFDADSKFQVLDIGIEQTGTVLHLDITWQSGGQLERDGKFFVHLYHDPSQPPTAQMDIYLNAQPPANWLPSRQEAAIRMDLLSAGEYTLAVGFYDPVSGERYRVGENDRLFLGKIVVME